MPPPGLVPQAAHHVANRAYVGADAALHAVRTVHAKGPVGDETVHEEAAEEPRVDARPAADVEPGAAAAPGHDVGRVGFQPRGGLLLLALLVGGGVHIHERKSHVRLGHEQREDGVEPDAAGPQVGLEEAHGLPDGVARGAEGVDIVARGRLQA